MPILAPGTSVGFTTLAGYSLPAPWVDRYIINIPVNGAYHELRKISSNQLVVIRQSVLYNGTDAALSVIKVEGEQSYRYPVWAVSVNAGGFAVADVHFHYEFPDKPYYIRVIGSPTTGYLSIAFYGELYVKEG